MGSKLLGFTIMGPGCFTCLYGHELTELQPVSLKDLQYHCSSGHTHRGVEPLLPLQHFMGSVTHPVLMSSVGWLTLTNFEAEGTG